MLLGRAFWTSVGDEILLVPGWRARGGGRQVHRSGVQLHLEAVISVIEKQVWNPGTSFNWDTRALSRQMSDSE